MRIPWIRPHSPWSASIPCAEYVAVPERALALKPSNSSFDEAAAVDAGAKPTEEQQSEKEPKAEEPQPEEQPKAEKQQPKGENE